MLLFAYAAFCALEFSALLSPALWRSPSSARHSCTPPPRSGDTFAAADLARPVTPIFMILAGGAILAAVNLLLRTPSFTWTLSSVAVVIFARLVASHAQQIRDFYQDFDDDNAEGWKASVLGALLLLVNSVNLYLLVATFLGRFLNQEGERTDDPLVPRQYPGFSDPPARPSQIVLPPPVISLFVELTRPLSVILVGLRLYAMP